jgi:hypothetical protein
MKGDLTYRPCPRCYGSGRRIIADRAISCEACDGTGNALVDGRAAQHRRELAEIDERQARAAGFREGVGAAAKEVSQLQRAWMADRSEQRELVAKDIGRRELIDELTKGATAEAIDALADTLRRRANFCGKWEEEDEASKAEWRDAALYAIALAAQARAAGFREGIEAAAKDLHAHVVPGDGHGTACAIEGHIRALAAGEGGR